MQDWLTTKLFTFRISYTKYKLLINNVQTVRFDIPVEFCTPKQRNAESTWKHHIIVVAPSSFKKNEEKK